jgi:hypothetical protein
MGRAKLTKEILPLWLMRFILIANLLFFVWLGKLTLEAARVLFRF